MSILRNRPWLFFGPAALAAGGIAVALTLTSDHEQHRWANAALLLFVGWSFAFAGNVGWARRPQNRTGMLMVAVGFGVFVGSLYEANYALPFTLGNVFGSVFIAVFVQLMLAYPSGELMSTFAQRLVAAAYAIVVLEPFFDSMFRGRDTCKPHACPRNLLLVSHDHTARVTINAFFTVVGVALLAGALYLIVGRWRRATLPLRRILRPVYAVGSLGVLLLAVGFAVQPFSGIGNVVVEVALIVAFTAVPFVFLAGLLRSTLARGAGLETIFRDIPERASPEEVQHGLRQALGDPMLDIAYWYPAGGHFVDVAGNRVDLPPDTSKRVVTRLEYADAPIAALVHDAALLQQPELLNTVARAARVALERDRLLVEDRARAERYRALLNAMPDLMFRITQDGRYVGYRAQDDRDLIVQEVVGLTVWDRLPADLAERVMDAGRRALAERTMETLEYELDFGGAVRHYEGRIAAAGDDEFLLIVRNITERKLQERELQASRARIVAAGDAERRRLERNLHDGAQQRLVSLSLSLALAQNQLRTNPDGADQLLAASREELAQALEELRELARGIHPAVLTDRGLRAALDALATRASLPVEIDLDGPDLPAPVEAAAYYVVSEALANVAKYAGASHVRVSIAAGNGSARVEVADDGCGGADPTRGSGLRGLADRVAALEGKLDVNSPTGGGTIVRAEIPLGVG